MDKTYKLKTDRIGKKVECPDNDIACERVSEDYVEITFLKKGTKITRQ